MDAVKGITGLSIKHLIGAALVILVFVWAIFYFAGLRKLFNVDAPPAKS